MWLHTGNGELVRVMRVTERNVEWVSAAGYQGNVVAQAFGLHFVPAQGPWITLARRRHRALGEARNTRLAS